MISKVGTKIMFEDKSQLAGHFSNIQQKAKRNYKLSPYTRYPLIARQEALDAEQKKENLYEFDKRNSPNK
jgi:hypothetical protein